MTGFVYKWTNNINGKWYIGSHKGATDDGYVGSGKYFLRAVNEYGIDNFEREILFEGDYDKNNIRSVVEAQFLQENDAASNPMSYNRTNIVGPNCISKETKEKISNTLKGRPLGRPAWNKGKKCPNHSEMMLGKTQSRESNLKRSVAMKGRERTKEHQAKLIESMRGRKHSVETRKKMSEARKKYWKYKGIHHE